MPFSCRRIDVRIRICCDIYRWGSGEEMCLGESDCKRDNTRNDARKEIEGFCEVYISRYT